MRTYNPKDVILVVGGRAITGHADDSFIAAEKTEDGFTEYVGAKGEVSVAINANETGMIRITLASTSPSISYLNRLANRREIVSANVIDMNTNGIRAGGTECMVRKPANAEWGKEVGTREFEIFVADFTME